jgi:DinB superfamily
MTRRLPTDWESLSADHRNALEQYVATVRQLSPGSWNNPLAPGKWTPAEISSHLIASYRIMRAELAGGAGMALRLKPLQRWVLRRTVLPRILRGGPFPAGARAPQETRPIEVVQDLPESLDILTTEANALVEELTAHARTGRVRLTHAYFGGMSPRQSLQLLAVHTRHHARQVAGLQR